MADESFQEEVLGNGHGTDNVDETSTVHDNAEDNMHDIEDMRNDIHETDNALENSHPSEEVQVVENHPGGGEEIKKWPGWPGANVFRILVPIKKVGGIIGRKGEYIKKTCEETKARIKILDGPHGITERAVVAHIREIFYQSGFILEEPKIQIAAIIIEHLSGEG